jgi:biofilm PGA synthesis lipoprotein PgaB
VSDAELTQQWRLLQRQGVRHIGYYPDDFLKDQPALKTLQRSLSVRSLLRRSLPGSPPPRDIPSQLAGLPGAGAVRIESGVQP